MNPCSEIKHCEFEGKDPQAAGCPVHAKRMSCWEYDWAAFWKAMPDGPDKESGRKAMLQECSSCPVRSLHPEEVDRFMALVRG